MSRKPINAAGVLFFARETNRHLFLLRNDKLPTWSLPGGKMERGEALLDTLERECMEEIDFWPADAKLLPIERYQSEDGLFSYHTLFVAVDREFIPVLNHEHLGYCWVNYDTYPRPLHRGLAGTLATDMIQQKLAIIRSSIR